MFVGVNADNDKLLVFMLFVRLVDELLILIFIGLEACCSDAVPLFIVVEPLMPKPMLLLPLLLMSNAALPLAPPPILKRSAFKFCKKPPVPPKSVEEFKAAPVKLGFVPPPLPPPPLTAVPKSELPLSTLGAEVLRPSMGVGNAGLMKRSLARRFWKN